MHERWKELRIMTTRPEVGDVPFRQGLALSPRPRLRLLAGLFLSIALALVLMWADTAPSEANGTATLRVSSLGQTQEWRSFTIYPHDTWAHSFCTGSYETTLSKVRIYTSRHGGGTAPVVAIRQSNSWGPGRVLETLTNPSSIDSNLATAEDFSSSGLTLAANTRYFVSFELPGYANGNESLVLGTTASKNEDSTTEAGWEISDYVAMYKNGNAWSTVFGIRESTHWSHSRFRMAVFASQSDSADGRPLFHDYPCDQDSGLYNFYPLESLAEGGLVGTVEARDPGSDTLTYSVSGPDAAAFSQAFTIGANNGEIRVKAGGNFNYELRKAYPYRVVVNVTDGNDSSGNAESPALTDISGAANIKVVNVKEPGFVTFSTSTPQVGVQLTATLTDGDEVWPYDPRFRMPRWQWSKSDTADGTFTDIAGATGKHYTPSASDLGKFLMADVFYHDHYEGGQRAEAKLTTAVAAEPALTASLREAPSSHNGSSLFYFKVGFSNLLSDNSKASLDDAFTITGAEIIRSWTRLADSGPGENYVAVLSPSGTANATVSLPVTTNCSNSGAVCSKYGATLSNILTFTVTGPGTGAEPNNPATGAPAITGTARVGETLTATTTAIADTDGLTNVSYSYQWLADDADISGATASTYTLVAANEGDVIKVRVTFTDDDGNDESLTSEPTAAVAAAAGLTLESATVDGTALTLTYNETLDDGVTLPASAFSVSVNGTPAP